jgi:sodium/potassium/calcium exchanger 6
MDGNAAETDGTMPCLAGLTPPSEASLLGSVLWALLWPSYAVRWVLIPPADLWWNSTRRVICSAAPLANVIFFTVAYIGGVECLMTSVAGAATAAVASGLGLAIFFGSDKGPAVPRFYPALTLLAKASSVLVLSVLARELTACIETLGLVHGVPRLWLGTTVIAWGNSLGDFVTGVAMVREGQARVALTAVFAGPLFNLLCGVGCALWITATAGTVVAPWKSIAARTELRVHVGFLMTSCAVLFCLLLGGGWRRRSCCQAWPCLLWVVYALFLLCALSAERFDIQT